MKTIPLLIPAILLLFAAAAPAQNTGGNNNNSGNNNNNAPPAQGNGEESGIQGYWEIEVPSGRFIARLDQITSVSQHTYIIDPGVRVYEVTVDTDGSMTARFYFLEPVTDGSPLSLGKNTIDRLREAAGEAGARAGVDTEHDVMKHYPDTTHAKTAEYRIVVKENISRIYDHIHRVWALERGRGKSNKLRIRNE